MLCFLIQQYINEMPAHTSPIEVCAGNLALSYFYPTGFLSPVVIRFNLSGANIGNNYELPLIFAKIFSCCFISANTPISELRIRSTT